MGKENKLLLVWEAGQAWARRHCSDNTTVTSDTSTPAARGRTGTENGAFPCLAIRGESPRTAAQCSGHQPAAGGETSPSFDPMCSNKPLKGFCMDLPKPDLGGQQAQQKLINATKFSDSPRAGYIWNVLKGSLYPNALITVILQFHLLH